MKKEFLIALKVSIPVFMGYSVLGFAFGLLLVSNGFEWYLATLLSIFIYAGALQFATVGFLSAKLSLIDVAITSYFINIRQSFYGLSLLEKFKNTKLFKPYLIFSLTDETYALLTSIKEEENISKKHYYLFLGALNQSYWVLGSTLGAIFGSNISFSTQGIEFCLTALFVVLSIEQYKTKKKIFPFLIGTIASIIALISSNENMLIVAIVISLIILLSFKKEAQSE